MSLDPIDCASPSTSAINCWVAIKRLGTPTLAEIVTSLASLSNDALDNIDPISSAYVSTGLGVLLGSGLVTVAGAESRYSIPDPARFIQRVGVGLDLVPTGAAYRGGYQW